MEKIRGPYFQKIFQLLSELGLPQSVQSVGFELPDALQTFSHISGQLVQGGAVEISPTNGLGLLWRELVQDRIQYLPELFAENTFFHGLEGCRACRVCLKISNRVPVFIA